MTLVTFKRNVAMLEGFTWIINIKNNIKIFYANFTYYWHLNFIQKNQR